MNTISNEYLSRRAGFVMLCVVVAFVAVWLIAYGKKALVPPQQTIPALAPSTDLVRFNSDAWYLPKDELLGFVEIPAGTFVMGSNPEVDRSAFENERWSPTRYQGKVDAPSFFIGRYEVTVAQFRAFVAASHFKVSVESVSGEPTHPVVNVSWTDALAYARWLDEVMKTATEIPQRLRELLNAGWQVSLPTEAQWEKAARGADGRIYPWGNTPSRDYANINGANTAPVGSRKCFGCAYELSDMSGNVWELTRSTYRSYPYDEQPRGDRGGDALFVMRGGSFADSENTARAATRGGVDPGARRPFIGFRVVISKVAPTS